MKFTVTNLASESSKGVWQPVPEGHMPPRFLRPVYTTAGAGAWEASFPCSRCGALLRAEGILPADGVPVRQTVTCATCEQAYTLEVEA